MFHVKHFINLTNERKIKYMSSSNKTSHLNLNQWEKSDKFRLDDFNKDNQLIDEGFGNIISDLEAHKKDDDMHINTSIKEEIKNHLENKDIHTPHEEINILEQKIEEHIKKDDIHQPLQKIDEIKTKLLAHEKNDSLHIVAPKIEKINLNLTSHTQDKNIHVDPVDFANIKSHVKDSKAHVDPASFSDLKSSFSSHSQDKKIHVENSVIDGIKSSLTSHTQDKNIHVDPVDFANIKSHVKDSKAHVDPLTLSQINSHIADKQIHLNQNILKTLNEHITNKNIHTDQTKKDIPFYYIGSYIGSGNEQQLIKLPFEASFIIVFANKLPPVTLATATGETVITSACCTKSAASPGITPTPDGFIAQSTKAYQINKLTKHLNTKGTTYNFIAFK